MSQMSQTPSNYPPTSMSGEQYPKVPLSGASGFSADPQDMPLPPSVPSVQLSLASHDQGAPIRTQYAYAPSGASQLSGSAATDSALSVPRYVDNNPRPTKSPRHNSQPSGSLTTPGESASEYRYGSSYHDVALNTTSADFHSAASSGQGDSSTPNSAPGRDYYPPASTWTSSGESSAPTSAYATDGRSYSFDAYKTGSAPPPPSKGPVSASGAPVYSSTANYSWSQ